MKTAQSHGIHFYLKFLPNNIIQKFNNEAIMKLRVVVHKYCSCISGNSTLGKNKSMLLGCSGMNQFLFRFASSPVHT